MVPLLFSIAVVLQIVALLFALWMIFHSTARAPWVMLGAAMTCMLVYRVVGLATSGMQSDAIFSESTLKSFTAALSMLTSLLLLLALLSIRRVTLAQQAPRSGTKKRSKHCRPVNGGIGIANNGSGSRSTRQDLASGNSIPPAELSKGTGTPT